METVFYELTNPQKSIWNTEEYYKGTSINNINCCWNISHNPNISALKFAFNMLLKNNDSYRTRIIMKSGIPHQYFYDYAPIEIDTVNISNISEYHNYVDVFSRTPIDINSSLYRVKILLLWDGSASLLLTIHHLIGDAWSLSLTLQNLETYYHNCLLNNNSDELNPSYIDFIKKQIDYNNSDKFLKDKQYWESAFNSIPETLSLKKSINISTNSERAVYTFSDELTVKIKDFCLKNHISDYIFLLSIFSIYFRNIYDNKNYIIGNPVLNRANHIEKQTSGLFISIMPFKINIDDSLHFIDFCHQLSVAQKNMYRHIQYPFHCILKYIRDKMSFDGSLYDCVFSYQNKPTPSYVKWIPNHSQAESIQIHIKSLSVEKNHNLSIHYDYLIDVFNQNEIENMHLRIVHMIEQVLNNWEILNSQIEIVSEKELNIILNKFNNTKVDYNKNSNLAFEFENIAMKYPDKTAVIDNSQSLTYKELNNKSNYLANTILSKCNNQKNAEIIAFALPRNINIYLAILAILKLGKTYLPIDPEYPIERINYMLKSSNASILITTKEFYNEINYDKEVIFIEDLTYDFEYPNLNLDIPSSSNAYVMYTSGSTGTPKGVTIQHYNVLNFVKSMQMRLNYDSNTNNNVISVTTVCFDIFVFETFPTLLSGLTLVIADELASRSPVLLGSMLQKYNITKILTTPSRIELLLESEQKKEYFASLKEIILGGEPVPIQIVNDLKKISSARIYDLYGPTETTVYSSFNDVTDTNEISIGRPINNTQIYILNSNNKLLPINTIGEICIAGDGVGPGYYNNQEKTDLVFIDNPYSPGLLYKTGDLGYYKDDGTLICLGRKDTQVKIRGYRIELDDISNNILLFDNIEKCVVLDKKNSNGNIYLCAYFTAKTDIDTSQLKKFLVRLLPNYMIPSHYVQLKNFPLTINHKINKKALPEPSEQVSVQKDYIAPQNEIQSILCSVIAKIINVEKIGIDDDIFDYNIDSLTIIKIQTKLIDYDIQINTQEFYIGRTIKNIAENISTHHNKVSSTVDTNKLEKINTSFIPHEIPVNKAHNKFNNILLTGVTGFLGIHILNQLLETTSAKITCTIRLKDKNISVEQRLKETYSFYFNKEIDFSRISILASDITLPNLGISEDKLNNCFSNIDLIINTAANVRYYGLYDDFKKINIDVVEHLIDISKKYHCKLIHISTMGLAGKYLIANENNKSIFTENDYYIGQNFEENVYLYTKSKAEELIFENADSQLDVSIIRVGNLTSRYEDGRFQKNVETNAFYNILQVIFKYKILPIEFLNESIEFTPIDYCAQAITQLIYNYDTNKRVFHVFNNNLIKVSDLIDILKKLNVKIDIIPGYEFKNRLLNISKTNLDTNIVKNLINELNDKSGITVSAKIYESNEYTNSYLKDINFNWPTIDYNYIKKILKDMNI